MSSLDNARDVLASIEAGARWQSEREAERERQAVAREEAMLREVATMREALMRAKQETARRVAAADVRERLMVRLTVASAGAGVGSVAVAVLALFTK